MTDPGKWETFRKRWDELPILSQGESKDIRVVDEQHVMVRLIPSLYSYTHNRSAKISGTDIARLRVWEILNGVIRAAGLLVAPVAFGSDYCVTRRLRLERNDYVPPIEVVVKARHVGTPKHSLYRAHEHHTPFGSRLHPDRSHLPYVRFDYTNPLLDDEGKRLRDECIPAGLARRYIDVAAAETTALAAFAVLFGFLSSRGVRLDDICFKIDHSGYLLFGEISQDCMRSVWVGKEEDFFGSSGVDTSKDTFRAGSSPEMVAERYDRFLEAVASESIRPPMSPFELAVSPEA